MSDDDSPWLDDEPHHPQALPSSLHTAPNQISQQEWEKLSSRYSDVSGLRRIAKASTLC